MLNSTKTILKKSEDIILSHAVNKGLYSWLIKNYWHPFILMIVGSTASNKSLKRLILCLIYTIIALSIINPLTFPPEVKNHLYIFLGYTALTMFFFPTPYQYSFQGVNDLHILLIPTLLKEEFKTINELTLFKENLRRSKEQVKSRVNSFQILLGTIWGIHLFLYTIIEEPISSLNKVHTPFSLPEFVIPYLFFLSVFILLWGIINSYKQGSYLIFDCIEYSCINVKDEYLKNEEAEQKRYQEEQLRLQQEQLLLLREIRDQGRAGSNVELSPVNNLAESLVRTWSKISKKSLIYK